MIGVCHSIVKIIQSKGEKVMDILQTHMPHLISKSTNSILMTLYATLYKNCSRYRSVICFKVGLELDEIIRCLCTKVVFLQIIGGCAVAWTSSIEFVACMSSENCCA